MRKEMVRIEQRRIETGRRTGRGGEKRGGLRRIQRHRSRHNRARSAQLLRLWLASGLRRNGAAPTPSRRRGREPPTTPKTTT